MVMIKANEFGPLRGIRVADFSIMAAGPWTAALLGELGAEVIKVEAPAGDGTRWVQPLQRGMGTNYISMNVNKRGITLDLKDSEGLEAAKRLVASCDILVQNFSVGTLGRLGLSYETVKAINPRMIYCSISGFGSIGPLAKERCADYIMQAASGFARVNGPSGTTGESFRFTGFLDLSTALVATEAVLVALLEREATGEGQHVDISMLEAALEIQYTRVAEALIAGQIARPMGSETPSFAPDRAFATVDNDVFMSVHSTRQWAGLCEALGCPELEKDERFVTNVDRVANREELNAILEPIFASRPAIWWMRALERHGVPVGLAQHFEIFRHNAQVVDNAMIAELDTDWGRVSVGGLPWHFSQTPCLVTAPPHPGADTAAVLEEIQ